MKSKSIRLFALLLATACFFTFTTRAQAGPRELLREAYGNLAEADHDYKGHRAAAMKQIEAAAKLLGENLRGEGKAHEKQGVSDDHLRQAANLLSQAKGGVSGKALMHIEKAENDLSVALSIK